jgi:hypothetical protein
MNLSPNVRALLTALVAALAVVAVALPTLGAPVWVGIVLGALSAGFGALGIVPPQVGGTQAGVVNPTVVEPPAADVVAAPK